jgi:hypothetical protein
VFHVIALVLNHGYIMDYCGRLNCALYRYAMIFIRSKFTILILDFQEIAQKIGEVIAKSCLEKGITKVVFDRGGFLYHGRIKALADAAREHGLEF